MITGVEICMVVMNSLEALALYEKVFEVERVEVTDFGPGLSEVVFTIFGTRFHLLDENPSHMMFAPRDGDPRSMWINTVVPDIQKVFTAAMEAGCTQIAPISEIPEFGIKNAIFADPCGYLWMLHQIEKVISHEERVEILKKQMQ
jgi:PhnB protein